MPFLAGDPCSWLVCMRDGESSEREKEDERKRMWESREGDKTTTITTRTGRPAIPWVDSNTQLTTPLPNYTASPYMICLCSELTHRAKVMPLSTRWQSYKKETWSESRLSWWYCATHGMSSTLSLWVRRYGPYCSPRGLQCYWADCS